MKLDLTSFRDAFAALERSMTFLSSNSAKKDPLLHEQFRNSAIQCFEFTHELAFKMMKRQLEQMSPDPAAIDKMAYMDIVRSAAEAGLVTDIARFKDYRDKRNITSHTYNQAKAEKIEAILPDFRDDMRSLLAELEKRNR
ncbi:MAG: HI0074 family nucleotidyltransferase substrate-binding subunit [Nitrospirota bacterium]